MRYVSIERLQNKLSGKILEYTSHLIISTLTPYSKLFEVTPIKSLPQIWKIQILTIYRSLLCPQGSTSPLLFDSDTRTVTVIVTVTVTVTRVLTNTC